MNFWRHLFRGRRRAETYEAVRERQERFRKLVAENNHVLELIAEAGEMLGGEYIFDTQYLRTLVADLNESVRSVVYNLNAMTDDRYTGLMSTSGNIEADLRAILESRVVVPEAAFVISLAKIDQTLSEVVGDKMARLGEVRKRLKSHVPDGFVISSHACQCVFAAAGVDRSIEEWFGGEGNEDETFLAEKAAVLQERILNVRLPGDVTRAIRRATAKLEKKHPGLTLAVRSSALGEDGDLSFAGQYRSLLGVPPADVLPAFQRVVASMYSLNVMRYRRGVGLHPARGGMAVGCLAMVAARAGGVLYTLNPMAPDSDVLLVTAALGLGKTVADGTGGVDRFEVSREPPHEVLSRSLGRKENMYVVAPAGGFRQVAVEEGGEPAVTDAQLAELAAAALGIETYMRCALDIEWAVDRQGRVFVLQARPLRIPAREASPVRDLSQAVGDYPVLLEGRGEIACRGIGCGRVHVVAGPDSLTSVPEGAVLVARNSTPWLASAMMRASAVITDIGSATGHLAAVARELRLPAIVDAGTATEALAGAGEVTVDAEEKVVYGGVVKELLHYQLLSASSYEDTAEFRLLRKILKRVAPLNLKDPHAAGFSPANCLTYHDVIRFAHEKAVEELTMGSWIKSSRESSRYVRRLELEAPLDLIIIDLGDGVKGVGEAGNVGVEDVTSAPLRAVLEGLTAEGVWATGPADMDLDGFMSSATRSISLAGPLAPGPEQNLALVSSRYLNLSLKLGYHYNIIDCYLTPRRNDNFIYFRFAGGVTETVRRSRRAELLRRILERYDFIVERKGDLVIGRIKKISIDAMKERLKMIGRLIGFTRQLDIYLRDDSLVERCVQSFLEGNCNPFEC